MQDITYPESQIPKKLRSFFTFQKKIENSGGARMKVKMIDFDGLNECIFS